MRDESNNSAHKYLLIQSQSSRTVTITVRYIGIYHTFVNVLRILPQHTAWSRYENYNTFHYSANHISAHRPRSPHSTSVHNRIFSTIQQILLLYTVQKLQPIYNSANHNPPPLSTITSQYIDPFILGNVFPSYRFYHGTVTVTLISDITCTSRETMYLFHWMICTCF